MYALYYMKGKKKSRKPKNRGGLTEAVMLNGSR